MMKEGDYAQSQPSGSLTSLVEKRTYWRGRGRKKAALREKSLGKDRREGALGAY